MARKAKDNLALEYDEAALAERDALVAVETDDQILSRLDQRFEILKQMTLAVKQGAMRGMIVSGPPGVGKSHGVEEVLLRQNLFNQIADRDPNYEVVKGTFSSVGLYAKLHDYKEAGDVLVFDDADNIFFDMLSLNLLKAALDSSKKRVLSWNTDSRLLRGEGIPNQFEFKGSVIFITNIKFSMVKSKTLKEHLTALESRCHYIDLEMDTQREKLLRIRQIVGQGMLKDYHFNDGVSDEILNFIDLYKDKLRELSLRMVLKLADLYKSFPSNWEAMAENTCMVRG
jgi:hypothetical protein